MSKIMLINVTHAEESRVGIVENGQLESFEIESLSREHLKGNIYKGIVRRIHPAIEAAFVDIGADRDAFLPLDEICFRNLRSGRNGAAGDKERRRIKDLLKSGDEVLVQIVKEQHTSKPPTLSTFYSLPGRYLVLLPGSEDAGISRKIEGEERTRIREMIARLQPPADCGIIVRTAASFDEEPNELERDLAYLQRLWESIKERSESKRAPALVYREHDLVLRNIRDYFTPDIDEIVVDNEDVFERARDFLRNVMPGKEHLLRLYQGEHPIFWRFQVETQIESIYKRRVQLKSGGSIVIDGTEALTAIDVNSGGSMRGASQEETAHKTNLEATVEIARQLRLRDLGGIIVIDFIDMRVQSHVNDVERSLRDAMRADKARHDIGRISRLGLLEVSRQRLRPAAAASSYTACPMCEGHGAVRTTESAALVALGKIHNRIAEGNVAQMKVSLPRDVAMYLLNQKRDDLAVLEARYDAGIQVVLSEKLMPHQSEIEVRKREISERPPAIARPGKPAAAEFAVPADGASRGVASERRVAEAGVQAPTRVSEAKPVREPAAGAVAAKTEPIETRARHRRRRGGRGRKAASATLTQVTTPAALPEPNEGASTREPTSSPSGETRDEAMASAALAEARAGECKDESAAPSSREEATLGAGDQVVAREHGEDAARLGIGDQGARQPAFAQAAAEEPVPAGQGDARTGEAAEPVLVAAESAALETGKAVTPAGSARRRRRRGGKRGGRGRKKKAAVATAAAAEPAPEGAAGAAQPRSFEDVGERPVAAEDETSSEVQTESSGPAARPRRRRGGGARRRSRVRSRTRSGQAADSADGHPGEPVAGQPAEPPAGS